MHRPNFLMALETHEFEFKPYTKIPTFMLDFLMNFIVRYSSPI